MPTISSMSRNNYMMLKYAQKTGTSLFGLGNAPQKSSGYQSVSRSYSPYASNLSYAAADVMKSYDTAAVNFKSEFTSRMDNLSKASNSIKQMNFDVGGKSAVTTTENADGTKTVTKSDALKDVLKGIENFAEKYNDAVELFRDSASVSKKMKQMSNVFSDTKYRAGMLSQIGVVVGNDGTMKLDEDVLTKAITENPSKVSRLLGKSGLAGKADDHVSFARSQQSRLFPSASSALSGVLNSSSLYGGNSLLSTPSFASVGNFWNSWI